MYWRFFLGSMDVLSRFRKAPATPSTPSAWRSPADDVCAMSRSPPPFLNACDNNLSIALVLCRALALVGFPLSSLPPPLDFSFFFVTPPVDTNKTPSQRSFSGHAPQWPTLFFFSSTGPCRRFRLGLSVVHPFCPCGLFFWHVCLAGTFLNILIGPCLLLWLF